MNGRRREAFWFALAACVSTAAQAKDLEPTAFRALYSMMMERDEITAVKSCAVVGTIAIDDARTAPSVGERSRESTPQSKHPISMTGSVTDWARAGFDEYARHATLTIGVTGRAEVKLTIANLWIVEKVYRLAEYDGRIVLDVSVLPPGGAAACWSNRVDGFAENYGRAGKEANYQETVNHALDRALLAIFGSAELQDALCTCGETAP